MITGPLPEGVNPSLFQKIVAAAVTGTIGISVANPADLVKIKMQGQGVETLKGIPPKYTGSMHCYRSIIAEQGIIGLWTGWAPNVMRNSVINAAELAFMINLSR